MREISGNLVSCGGGLAAAHADLKPAIGKGVPGGQTGLKYVQDRRESFAASQDQCMDTDPAYLKWREREDPLLRRMVDYVESRDTPVTRCTPKLTALKPPQSQVVGLSQKYRKAVPGKWHPTMLPARKFSCGKYSFFEFCALWKGADSTHRSEIMLYLRGDPKSKHLRKAREPLIPRAKTAARDRYNLWLKHGEPSTLDALALVPGVACVARGGWGRGVTGRPVVEAVEVTDKVTADHQKRKGGTNCKAATEARLGKKKRQSYESAGHCPSTAQSQVADRTALYYHLLQTSNPDSQTVHSAADNTGPR